jgi:hypothetical protein
MSDEKKSNLAKGRNSFDADVGGTLVPFFNRNVSEYPTEAGGVKFELVPVTKQKDLMINHARIYAQQEYDRIMELVAVLEKQAQAIKRRLDITDAVHAAKYDFKTYPGQCYWLIYDTEKNITRLTKNGPDDWSSSAPENYDYVCQVKWLGDFTWIEVT